MKYHVLLFLACLLLILPVTAYTVPQIQAVYGCSADQATSLSGLGQLSVTSTPSGAYVYLDNDNWIDATVTMGCTSFFGQTTCFPKPVSNTPALGNVSPGKHTIRVSMSGYNDETVTVNICSQKVTYATVNLAAIPTTVPTTLPTTAPVRKIRTFAQTDTTPVPGTTTLPAGVTTTVSQAASATAPENTATTPQNSGQPASDQQSPAGTGSLSVTTTPAGAFIFIDGVQRGVSPASIPGLAPGDHTILLKLDGYQDLSTPVMITAGYSQDYATSLILNTAAGATPASTQNTTAGAKKGITPGFEFTLALAALGAVLVVRKLS